jgi:hypothetical protein
MNAILKRGIPGVMALIVLPMAGVWMAGLPMAPFLAFPPEDLHVSHAPFSWTMFLLLVAFELVAIGWAVHLVFRGTGTRPEHLAKYFPWWGWLGLVWTIAWWLLAWSRHPLFSDIQMYSFTPLWLGYIVVVNALAYRAAGRCLLLSHTRYLLLLFPLSAGFWWFFEYLNRFVQNWMYHGVAEWSAWEYFSLATLSFSTVLPAVMSTDDLLSTLGIAHRADDRPVTIPSRNFRMVMCVLSIITLGLLGIAPNVLFPFLWLAPLGLLILMYPADHFRTVFPTPGTMLRLSLAALICGFFWELWNFHSLAKWIYHVPYVGKFHVFEMPFLGYFGYLPFGWECAWLAAMVRR